MSSAATYIHGGSVSPAAGAGKVNLQIQSTAPYAATISYNGETINVTETDWTAEQIIAIGQSEAVVKTASYPVVEADDGAVYFFNSASALTATLLAAVPYGTWKITLINIGTGVLTIAPNGLNLNGSSASITLAQNTGVTIFTDGTNYVANLGASAGTATTNGTLGITIDGGGSVPSTGTKGFLQVPYDCTIDSWTMIANAAGSAVIGVKLSTYAGFPTTSSIVASAPPTLSSAQNATSSTLTGWTTALAKGDVLEFDLSSVATITRVTLQLAVTRSD
jgi:hypothetical protein